MRPLAVAPLLLVVFAACPGPHPGPADAGDPDAQCERVLKKVRLDPPSCAEGQLDEERGSCAFFAKDRDGDGERAMRCSAEGIVITTGDDCDDADPAVKGHTYFIDADNDGFGSSAAGAASEKGCELPAGFVESSSDCNDAASSAHPGATEVCSAEQVDEDCNGMVNEGCGCPFAGDTQSCCTGRGTMRCEASGAGTAWSMCSAMPSAEVCDGADNDCDGQIDETGPAPLCAVPAQSCTMGACRCPAGQTLCGTACVSNVGAVCSAGVGACMRSAVMVCNASGAVVCGATAGSPATEIACNGIDDNCNGTGDEAAGAQQYWADCDGDGYGAGVVARSCTRPTRCNARQDALQTGDCNDNNAGVNPSRSSQLQCGTDLDCDGNAYENHTCQPNTTASCVACPAFNQIFGVSGSRTCSAACSYPACSAGSTQTLFGPTANAFYPDAITGFPSCSGQGQQGGTQGTEYFVSYRNGTDCAWLKSRTAAVSAGSYVFSFDNYDTAVLVTPMVQVVVRDENGVVVTSGIFSNTNAGWEAKSLAFSVAGCRLITIEILEFAHNYQGANYVGGNYVGHFMLRKL